MCVSPQSKRSASLAGGLARPTVRKRASPVTNRHRNRSGLSACGGTRQNGRRICERAHRAKAASGRLCSQNRARISIHGGSPSGGLSRERWQPCVQRRDILWPWRWPRSRSGADRIRNEFGALMNAESTHDIGAMHSHCMGVRQS
jgi:hypothetical protein